MTNGNNAPNPPSEIVRPVYALYNLTPEEIQHSRSRHQKAMKAVLSQQMSKILTSNRDVPRPPHWHHPAHTERSLAATFPCQHHARPSPIMLWQPGRLYTSRNTRSKPIRGHSAVEHVSSMSPTTATTSKNWHPTCTRSISPRSFNMDYIKRDTVEGMLAQVDAILTGENSLFKTGIMSGSGDFYMSYLISFDPILGYPAVIQKLQVTPPPVRRFMSIRFKKDRDKSHAHQIWQIADTRKATALSISFPAALGITLPAHAQPPLSPCHSERSEESSSPPPRPPKPPLPRKLHPNPHN